MRCVSRHEKNDQDRCRFNEENLMEAGGGEVSMEIPGRVDTGVISCVMEGYKVRRYRAGSVTAGSHCKVSV